MFTMPNIRDELKMLRDTQKNYFNESGDEIAFRNLRLIRTTSQVGMFIYCLYLVLTVLFFKRLAISLLYGLIVPVLLLFMLYANRAMKAKNVHARGAQRAALLLYIVMMVYALLMSVFPHPNMPAVYYPLFLLMAPVLFILPASHHLAINLSTLITFFFLVYHFKDAACWNHDLFEATTASVFSIVVIVFMTQFRLQSDCLKDKYYKLSQQDLLTGVVNKTTGTQAAQEYLNHMREDEIAALFFIDIDDFKKYNDTYGHLEGDRMLTQIGAALSTFCRKGDTACRFGGDEFIVLLKDIQSAAVAEQRAGDIIEAIARFKNLDMQPTACSIGVCICRSDTKDICDVIRRADSALYTAKCNGKNGFAVYSEQNAGVAFSSRIPD